MPRPPSPDILALEVAKLRTAPVTDATRPALRSYLAHKSNLVAAKAAEVTAALKLADLTPDLEQTFARFFSDPDKGCLAKSACAAALHALAVPAHAAYLRGLHHVQPESSWGPPVDAAAGLRATCALALASHGCPPAALADLADLLADPLAPVRAAAARALAHAGHDSAALPIRLRLLAGDPDPEVLEECLAALVKLTPRPAVPFLARLLDRTPDPESQAPLLVALGTTRDPAALDLLLTRFDRDINPATREHLIPAIALSRLPQAVDFLIDQIATGHIALATAAIDALVPFRSDKNVISRVGKVLAERDQTQLLGRFRERFGT